MKCVYEVTCAPLARPHATDQSAHGELKHCLQLRHDASLVSEVPGLVGTTQFDGFFETLPGIPPENLLVFSICY